MGRQASLQQRGQDSRAPAPPPAKQADKFPPPTPKPVAPPLWLSGQLPPTPKFSSTSGNGGGYGGVRGGGGQGWRGGRGRAAAEAAGERTSHA
jgi:hypothetical protein